MKSNIYPVKITAKSEGIENAETLLQEKRLQIGLSEPDTVQIKGGGYLILDFRQGTVWWDTDINARRERR